MICISHRIAVLACKEATPQREQSLSLSLYLTGSSWPLAGAKAAAENWYKQLIACRPVVESAPGNVLD